MRSLRPALGPLVLLLSQGLTAAAAPAALTFDQRVEAQRAVESVYWAHRIWPAENPQAKPPLSAVLSEQTLHARVEDTLRKSAALEALWEQPITGGMLRAELDRMIQGSRQADLLNELFAALGHDPVLIAETLARPALADRLLRSWYSADSRVHGAVRREAELRRTVLGGAADRMRTLGAAWHEITWRRGGDDGLSPGQYDEIVGRLERRFGGHPEPGQIGPLQEDDTQIYLESVIARTADTITVRTAVWDKTPFDQWWSGERANFAPADPAPQAISGPLPDAAGACQQNTWSQSPFSAPDPRSDHTAVWTGTEMIVWGGYNGGSLNVGGRYNPATDLWTETPSTGAPASRDAHTAVWTGTEMIIWGGETNGVVTGTGARYNPTTNSWSTTNPTNAPTARSGHVAQWTGTVMIVWGGTAGGNSTDTGGRYNPSTNTWLTTNLVNAPSPRVRETSVWTGSNMIVFGGIDDNGNEVNSGGRYNPTTDVWSATTTTGAPTTRYDHTAVWTGTRMVVWGGVNIPLRLNTGGIYDPVGNTWVATSTGANVPVGRGEHVAVWTGTRMIIWGGNSAVSPLTSGAIFDPGTNAWTGATSLTNVPTDRMSPTAVWTGSRMIVWGGQGPISVLGTGGRYDPVTDTWTATSRGTGLTPRYGHTGTWTGNELIMWGGWDGVMITTGGRYNPATDTWAFMTTSGSPSPRVAATAVWSGSRMILYGGNTLPALTYLNSGGQYDPTNDQWNLTTTASAPAPRAGHGMVWTGTRAIIWGGKNLSNYFDTGSRYDPVGDSWSATSNGAFTPSVRVINGAAAWTGTQMIVWGGYDGAARLNDGGRYDPVSDSWTAMTPTNAPTAREKHAVVWTGNDFVVFGGWNGTATVGVGGRYRPSTNTWLSMNPTGAPSAREAPGGVWTGTSVVILGGDNGGNAIAAGALYNPVADSWTSIPTAGGPIPMSGPTLVWTGSEVLVAGNSTRISAYCSCTTTTTLFQDLDLDTFGTNASTGQFCAGVPPAGWSATNTDCNDADGNAWAKPGEVSGVLVTGSGTLTWSAPAIGGNTPGFVYDTIRSTSPSNFFGPAICIESNNGPNVTAVDAATPGAGQAYFYLIRPQNSCPPPNDAGTLGFASSGSERTGRNCP